MCAMDRREFMKSGMAVGLYSAGSDALSPFLQAQDVKEKSGANNSTPAWITNAPIVVAGCWDDFPLFQLRKGGGPDWMEDAYRKQRDPRTIEALAKAGVTLAIIHFFKGFGLEAEREHIEDAGVLARLLKQNGIRVGLYVGATIGYETFLIEDPEANAWFAPDFMGKPLYYSDQTFRRRVYFMHPGYRAYIKRVLKYGIENLHPDLIHFDNTSLQARPGVFEHPMAIEDFRKYLGAKYSPAEMKNRLGFSDIRYVVAPDTENVPLKLDDPLFQEFAEFRCHQLISYYADMRSYIHSLNSSVAIDCNPSSGISGRNLIWQQGVDYPRLLNEVDAVWTEEGDAAGVTPEGILISKIRTLKTASSRKKHVFCYTWGATGNWGYTENAGSLLQMAESMAYNNQCLGMVGNVNAIGDLPFQPRQYIRFFHDNFDLYRNADSVADVALLSSFASIGFDQGGPLRSFMLAGQTLIQDRLLFDIIFDEDLENLSKYRALFLPDSESLSDRQIEIIRKFVMNGGGLVATELTSLYNEQGKRRRNFGLKDLFGISDLPNGSRSPDALLSGGVVSSIEGKGRVIYLPEIKPAIAQERAAGVRESQRRWALPANHQDISDAVLKALGGKGTLQTPIATFPYVTVELARQAADDRLILHLVNYNHAKASRLSNIPIAITPPDGKKVERIRMLTPDHPGKVEPVAWKSDESVSFNVPSLEIYSVVVLDLA